MRSTSRPFRRWQKQGGFSLVEVTIAIAILFTGLMATARSLVTSIDVVNDARRTARAALFLETVMEDVAAQQYGDLLGLNGNAILDGADAQSSTFRAEITAFQSAVDLVQVETVLFDIRTGRELGRVATLRSNR